VQYDDKVNGVTARLFLFREMWEKRDYVLLLSFLVNSLLLFRFVCGKIIWYGYRVLIALKFAEKITIPKKKYAVLQNKKTSRNGQKVCKNVNNCSQK
jgi:hypothetical protein